MTPATATRAWFAAGVLWVAALAAAQMAVPPLTARVTDQTATLTPGQLAAMEQTLQAFEARKGAQIAVLIVSTTGGEAIEPFSLRVAERWKLGRKSADDGALNDATSKRIISEIIVPRFRENDFYGGIDAGIAPMIRVIDGEPLPPLQGTGTSGARDQAQNFGQMLPALVVLTLIAGPVMRAVFGRVPGAVTTGGAVGLLAWWLAGALTMAFFAGAIAFLFTLFGGGAGRMLGAHGGGFGRGGGFGNGGFGGGGGFGGNVLPDQPLLL